MGQLACHELALLPPFYKPDCTKRFLRPLSNISPYGQHDVKQSSKTSDTVHSFLCLSMGEYGYSEVTPAKSIIIMQMDFFPVCFLLEIQHDSAQEGTSCRNEALWKKKKGTF